MIGEHRIRVRVQDGKKSKWGQVKAKLGMNLNVWDSGDGLEFVVAAMKGEQIVEARSKLAAAGLKEIPGSTEIGAVPVAKPSRKGTHGQFHAPVAHRGGQPRAQQPTAREPLRKKPYGFVPLPDTFTVKDPVWHDGSCSQDRLSGEVRLEFETLTPLLVGWERRKVGEDSALRELFPDLPDEKSVLCPLRAPWVTGRSLSREIL